MAMMKLVTMKVSCILTTLFLSLSACHCHELVRKRDRTLSSAQLSEEVDTAIDPFSGMQYEEIENLRYLVAGPFSTSYSYSYSYAPSQSPSAGNVPTKAPNNDPTKAPTKSPSKTPTKAPTQSPTTSSKPTTSACTNDSSFYIDDQFRTCSFIDEKNWRRSHYCPLEPVNNACTLTCGQCCYDSTSFRFTVRGEPRKCNWIKLKSIRPDLYCGLQNTDGTTVADHCPDACGKCRDKIDIAPTAAPVSPTASPTMIPRDGYCGNDVGWMWYDSPQVTCTWIRHKENRRIKFCPKPGVEDACPQSCGLCCMDDPLYNFVTNNVIADCEWVRSSSARKTEYCGKRMAGRLVSDVCPLACNECQFTVTAAPTPSAPATPAPTTTVCLNDNSWAFYNDPKMTCRFIRNKENRRKNYCARASVRKACPQSCGICCMDDPSFSMDPNDSSKNCDFVGQATNTATLCNQRKNDRMVRDACPKTCDKCLDPPAA